MARIEDQYGMTLTAASQDAAARYDTTLMAYMGLRQETGDRLKELFETDPDMPMAYLMRGNFMKLFAKGPLERKAQESLAKASELMAAGGATARETLHREALECWCRGDLVGAVAAWERVLLNHPHDLLAMRLAHFMHFYLGDAVALRDSIARVLPHWDASLPGYGFVEGLYAFGLEESGDYAKAERWGRQAVESNPTDIWATHAVAHVMEMQGRHREGVAWLDGMSSNWRDANNFAYHCWWHKALFHLEMEQHDAVLALYDGNVRADLSDDYLDMSNAIALLWRLEQQGVGVGKRWEELAEKCLAKTSDHLFVFHDMHYLMALLAGGQAAEAEAMLQRMQEAAAEETTTEGPIYRKVGLPLGQALAAVRRGDYARAVDLIEPIRYEIRTIGGSHAQRDVFIRTFIEAAVKAGRYRTARALLAERLALNPNNVWGWRRTAEALEGLQDVGGAAQARDEAAKRLAA